MKHQLEADSIQLAFGARTILSSVYLPSTTGRITGLLGRNGQGKSCLLNIIYGTLTTESKSVRIDGKAIFKAYERPDLLLYLPQFYFIPKGLSLKRVFRDFEVDYSDFEKDFPEFRLRYTNTMGSLSGGERRLVELYLILVAESQFALLDEPFTQLNPLQIEKAKELLLHIKERKGLVITDHLFRHVIDISDDLYLLIEGSTRKIQQVEEVETLGYARL